MTPSRSCHCNEFSRSHLVRRAVAEAGRGLPAIEPGMPLPAGTGLDRRTFLARSAGLALGVYGASKLSFDLLDEGIARAASAPPGRVLVSVFLDGGADSMSVLFPSGDPRVPQAPASTRASRVGRTGFRRGLAPALASRRGAPGRAARRREADDDARGRIHGSRPVPLHLSPLLGGGSNQLAAPNWLDRPVPRSRRRSRQPASGPLARLAAPAVARHQPRAGGDRRQSRRIRLLGPRRLGRGRRPDAADDRPARGRAAARAIAGSRKLRT